MRTKSITKNVLPVTAIMVVSSFAILFPFFSSKAQKVKKEIVKEEKYNDSAKTRSKSITIKGGDLDKTMADLDNSMKQLDNLNLDEVMKSAADAVKAVDLTAIEKSVTDAMKSVNVDQIQQQVKLALQQVNMDSIQQQVKLAMQSIDTDKMKADIDKAMAELKNSNWQAELDKGMKEMKVSMAEIKNINGAEIKKELENARKEMENAKITMKDEMAKARVEVEKARGEMTQLRTLLQDLQKDGLIKKGEDVKLEWKSGRLYINGKEQSAEVSEKYKALEKLDINIDGDDDNQL
jgi:hypothetical protein